MACNGLKMGQFHLFRNPKCSRIIFGKRHFRPIVDAFLSQKSPLSRLFGILGGPKQATKSPKRSCFGIPRGPRSFLKKIICKNFERWKTTNSGWLRVD